MLLEASSRPGFGPGKTAPRFLDDLLLYRPTSGHNSIADVPPRHDARQPPVKHQHTLTVVESLSKLDHPSTSNEPRVLATICETCQAHIEVEFDVTKRGLLEPHPCPHTQENPLHHLRHDPLQSKVLHHDGTLHGREKHIDVFVCSARSCPALVTVTYKPPILSKTYVKLLTDFETLRQRAVRAASASGEQAPTKTTGLAYQTLRTLVQYLNNALRMDTRPIPRKNRRYVATLSDDCGGIFYLARFTEEKNEAGLHWVPPPAHMIEDESTGLRRDLEEMVAEASVLQDRHKGSQPPSRENVTRAERPLKEMFGCNSYGGLSNSVQDLSTPEHPSYALIGAIADFPDRLLTWAFERQRECDPERGPYYFECLQILAEGRRSETLQMEVAMLRSRGEFTHADVVQAGRSLGIHNVEKDDEDLIIGIFKARLQDAPKQEAQMRESLTIIGKYRKSDLILRTAQKAFTSANGAYNWLGIPDTTDDQFILSTYNVRIKDSPADEPVAKEALRLIAETRQSPLLLSFLETGSVYDTPPMDLNDAFRKLQIQDQTIEDEVLIDVFNIRLQDAPSQLSELRAALRIIGEHRSSTKIKEYLQTGSTEAAVDMSRQHEWPAGLENIGNTCYLNSLLQFYFTIKPLREMILNIDRYEEGEITDEVMERKRVGGRKVSKAEIERAKKFVGHLRTLFHDLIASQSSAVTPERDLAYLALVSSKEEAERRNSVTENDKPVIVEADPDAMDIDPLLSDVPPPASTTPLPDNNSENTLVNEASMDDLPPPYDAENEDFVMVDQKVDVKPDDKENVAVDVPITPELANDTAGRAPLQEMEPMQEDPAGYTPMTPPPERTPPPVPPRPGARTTGSDINLMFGRQQDVTECIGNVMFQIEAAIKPQHIDENGEQVDLVKDYFYGKTKQTLQFPTTEEERTKEELFSHLLVNAADGDRDLYSALDGSFDVEQVDLEGKEAKRFLSITRLPPILQIQVQRVQFDRTKGSAYKSNALLSFPETIYMDRYMDTADDALKNRREESWKWKEEVRTLLKRKDALTRTPIDEGVPVVLEATREFLEEAASLDPDLSVGSDVIFALEQRAIAVTREIKDIDERLKLLNSRIAQQFTDLRKHPYRIHSVFIHRGSVSFGHYWIYIYDFQKGIFRKYNDQYVTAVDDAKEVFTHEGTNAPTPYFLVFVREDESLSITEAVKRVKEMEAEAETRSA